ncbi:MAG: GNAT family N-acetyltransferase [Coriobacteriia bacterium]|nr:GNAT family N-acetyltransferase [Coriobacteriia bacterium]
MQAIVDMHDEYYGSRWGFGPEFTAKNVAELADLLGRFDPARDGLWTAQSDGRIVGSVAIDGSAAEIEGAHLRWFLVSEAARGCGAGSRLLDAALGFCRDRSLDTVFLWTFAGLDDARRLYERSGFVLTEQHQGMRWGTPVLEQRLACRPGSGPEEPHGAGGR